MEKPDFYRNLECPECSNRMLSVSKLVAHLKERHGWQLPSYNDFSQKTGLTTEEVNEYVTGDEVYERGTPVSGARQWKDNEEEMGIPAEFQEHDITAVDDHDKPVNIEDPVLLAEELENRALDKGGKMWYVQISGARARPQYEFPESVTKSRELQELGVPKLAIIGAIILTALVAITLFIGYKIITYIGDFLKRAGKIVGGAVGGVFNVGKWLWNHPLITVTGAGAIGYVLLKD